jgi:hypothetical protein
MIERKRPEDFPETLWGGFMRYVEHGIPPGSFLRAVFEGDLHETCRRGSEDSIKELWPVVVYLHNWCPHGCYGNKKIVAEWIERGGLEGLDREMAEAIG